MFDSHVHFDAAAFAPDLDAVLERSRAAGIAGAVNPAVDLASSRRILDLHRRTGWILPAFGIHPLFLGDAREPPLAALEDLAAESGYVAVGEVGLDFWHGRTNEEQQRRFLACQAGVAGAHGLPLILHLRKGFYEGFAVLREAGFNGPGVCHAFTGSYDMARLALDRGFSLGVGAAITRPEKSRLRALLRRLPVESLLLETDAPDLPPWSRRGLLHRPWDLLLTLEALAELLGMSPAETATRTTANAHALFGRPPRGRTQGASHPEEETVA